MQFYQHVQPLLSTFNPLDWCTLNHMNILAYYRGWKLNNCIKSIHYSLLFSPNYSLFISNFSVIFIIHFLVFVSIFLSEVFYNAIVYIGYQKFTFQYNFSLVFSKYRSIFSIHVVKIMLSFSISRPSMQLLKREGPNNSSLITLSTKNNN